MDRSLLHAGENTDCICAIWMHLKYEAHATGGGEKPQCVHTIPRKMQGLEQSDELWYANYSDQNLPLNGTHLPNPAVHV